ncbi:MAG: outer membrane protein assembly factor BamE [Gammaproteobacteria bacterium]|nr:outer membrane protein assembly factor BamE [Gammaproteobacteria bacterium]
MRDTMFTPALMQKLLITTVLCASLILAGCSSVSIPGAYKIDIQQGNVITQEMVEKLKHGMSKNQVRFALGTPLLIDVFHQDRWDYVYSIQKGGQDRQQRRLALFFENDQLIRIEGDVAPAQGEPAAPES